MLVTSIRMKKNESTTYGKLKIHTVPPWHEDTKVCINHKDYHHNRGSGWGIMISE